MARLKRRMGGLAGVCGAMLFLSGGFQTYNMISTEFKQARTYEPSYDAVRQFVRSLTLYQGFETRAHFDVMWYSDVVAAIVSSLRACKQGDSVTESEAFVSREMEKNMQELTFYVLSDVTSQGHISLCDEHSAWSLYVITPSGQLIKPSRIKEVAFGPEIEFLFGDRFAPFKKSYRVTIPLKDHQSAALIHEEEAFSLVCAGAGIKGAMSWIMPEAVSHSELIERYSLQEATERPSIELFCEPKVREEDFFW